MEEQRKAPGMVPGRVNQHLWPTDIELPLRDGSFGYRIKGNTATVTDKFNQNTISIFDAGGFTVGVGGGKTGIGGQMLNLTATALTISGTGSNEYDLWFRYTKV